MILILLFFILYTKSLQIDPPNVLLPFFSTQQAPTKNEFDNLYNILMIEENARLNTLTSERLLLNIRNYRDTANQQILHQLRKLAHDYATESRSLVEKFMLKSKMLPNSLPLIALYHIRRIIMEMRYLKMNEKKEITDEIDFCTLPLDNEIDKVNRIKNNVKNAFTIAEEMKQFFAGKIEKSKRRLMVYRLVDLVEESTWPTDKKIKILELLNDYNAINDNDLLMPIAALFAQLFKNN